MKSGRLFLALLLVPLLAVVGCEGDAGPQGPAGQDGADGVDGVDGVDGNVTCMDCHGTAQFSAVRSEYARSQHALGEYVSYAGGRASCTRCHSGEGFVEFSETGGSFANFNVPIPIDCSHCHSVHTDFVEADYALRGDPVNNPPEWIQNDGLDASVTPAAAYDFGTNANMCTNCHQSRRPEPAEASAPGATTFNISSTHYGPHHGAQANVQAAVGWAEIDASDFGVSGALAYPTGEALTRHGNSGGGFADCVTCHMGAFDESEGAGGHTWWPSVGACQNCHSSATDFDYLNFQTSTQATLDAIEAILLQEGVIELVDEDGELVIEPVVGETDMLLARAFFNWTGLSEDRSKGLHNPQYISAILDNTLKALEAEYPAPATK